jgi:hypothetical protein
MSRIGALIVAGLLAAPGLFAGTLLSEDFQSLSGLSDGNWATQGSAFLALDPQNGANTVLTFANEGFGGDLFSNLLNYLADPGYSGVLFLSFDFLHTGGPLHAYVGTDSQTVPLGAEQWLWSDDGATPFATPLTTGVWQHVSFQFVPNVNPISLKVEAVPGVDFFDNFNLSAAPEPSTLAAGLLALAGVLIVRRRNR